MFGKKKLSLFIVGFVVAVSLFFVATTTGLILEEGEDPDRPPGVQGPFDEADYLQRREAFIALLRGNDPSRPMDPNARSQALKMMDSQIKAIREGRSANLLLDMPNWIELGPNPIPLGQTQTTRVPVSGRISAIEIDPADPNKVYVGAAQGGVYRSLDGGATWVPIFDNAQTLSIGSLTLDPSNGWLWVGTGEANGSADSFAGVGLYRIENVNTTADLVGPINPIRNYNDANNNPVSAGFFTGRSISKILTVPGDPNTLFCGVAGGVIGIGGNTPFGNTLPPLAMRGLVRLSNVAGPAAGITGQRVAVSTVDTGQGLCAFDTPCTVNRNVNDMVLDPQDPSGNTLIVWLNGLNVAGDGGIYRSTNAMSGAPTFTQTLITTSTSTSNGRGELRAYVRSGTTVVYAASGEPSTPNVAGGGTLCNSASNFGALRRSDNGGITWSAKLPGGGGFCGGQCFYNIGFDVLPGAATTSDKLLLGGNVRSTACAKQQATSLDGGATAFVNRDDTTHADTHVIKFAPSNSQIVYRGDDGGVWKSTNGGDTWQHQNNTTLRATQFQSIAVHPTDPDITIGGTQDNGTNKMVSGPVWSHSDDGDGGYAMIDQSTPNTMYHTFFNQAGTQIGYSRSTTGGNFNTWTFRGCSGTATTRGINCTNTVNFYAPTALGPGTPNTVYLGTDRLYRSANTGDSNTIVSQGPLISGVPISSIAISPQDDNYRIVGLNNGALFFTTTGSSTLTSLDPVGAGSVIRDFYVSRLAFDPTNKNTVYIAMGNYAGGTSAANSHVWKVTNLDTAPVLTPINGNGVNTLPDVPVSGFAVDPLLTSRLFAGTDIGVFVSYDSGINWLPYGVGLPRVAVFDMAIQNVKRVLRIATHGRGMWEIPLFDVACPAIGISPATLPNGTVGTGYSQTLIAAPGSGYTYSVSSGVLPLGLSLNASTGVISGTPSAPGSYNFRITATIDNCSGSRDYTVVIACPTINLSPTSLPAGTAGIAYSQSVTVSPAGSYAFSLDTGNLPSGLTLNSTTGLISGTPTSSGTLTFTVKAQASSGCFGTRSYTLVIGCPTVTVNPASLLSGSTGTAYSQTLSATPATGSYTFAVTSGALPGGLSLNAATGVLSGNPTTNGSFTFTVTATGFGACSGSRGYTILIGSGGCPTITLSSLPGSGTVGQLYSAAVVASPAGSYNYAVTSGALPPGLALYGVFGTIFGYPTAPGSYTFTITVTAANNCTASQSYTIVIGAGAASMLTVFSDFDGDGKSDLSVWRGADGNWLIARSTNGQLQSIPWGAGYAPYNDLIASGDYDGDGKTDLAVFRRGTVQAGHWYIKRSSDGQVDDRYWGVGTDVPVAGDYDGDGKTDVAVWRGSEGKWYISRSSDGATNGITWGAASVGDVPVPGDYDGDGKTDVAVFRRSTGYWYAKLSSNGQTLSKLWGAGTDVPVAGDYDGDGKTDIAVWRGSEGNWYIIHSSGGAIQTVSLGAGLQGDLPVAADYDGDGKADVAVWQPSSGTWSVKRSSDEAMMTRTHGQNGDSPIMARRN